MGGDGSQKECLAGPQSQSSASVLGMMDGQAGSDAINSDAEGAGEERRKDSIRRGRCD